MEFKTYPFSAKKYAARLPKLDNGVETKRHAVTIVGGHWSGVASSRQRLVFLADEADDPFATERHSHLAPEP